MERQTNPSGRGRRRGSHPVILRRLNRRKEDLKKRSESYPPSKLRLGPHIWYEGLSNNSVSLEMNLLWRKADIIRRYRRANYQLARLVSEISSTGGLSGSKPSERLETRSFFTKQIHKNVFYAISHGTDVLDPLKSFDLPRSVLIGPADLERFRKIATDFNVSTKDLNLDQMIYRSFPTRYHRLNVYRSYQRRSFILSEWKDQVSLSSESYYRLRERYQGPVALFDHYLFVIALRYASLRGRRFYQALPSTLIKKYQLIEGFSSPLEAVSDRYYSPFPDEKIFSSRGNFFHSDLPPGKYLVHPPSYSLLSSKVASLLREKLDQVDSTQEYHFLFVTKPDFRVEELISPYLISKDSLDQYRAFDHSYREWFSMEEFNLYYLSNSDPQIDLDEFLKDWKNKTG